MATTIPSGGGNLILGTNATEVILGTASNDTIYAYSGDDSVTGGNGQDYIDGGIGNDSLIGGLGNDTVLGGAGNDTVGFITPNDGSDTVFGFTNGVDRISIAASGFPGFNAGSLPANLFTTSGFSNATQRFFFNPSTRELIYDADGNGTSSSPKTLLVAPNSNSNIAASDIFVTGAVNTAFTLELLHASDFEGGLPALGAGGADEGDTQRFSAVINALDADPRFNNTIRVTSGDNYIPGPFLNASADPSVEPLLPATVGGAVPGRGDIAIMNELGIKVTVFGNHEFDQGTRQVRDQIIPAGTYPGAKFPYLSANLNFAPNSDLSNRVVADGQNASAIAPGSVTRSTFVNVNGENIGFVGVTTPNLRALSSPGTVGVLPYDSADQSLTSADLDALAVEIQDNINALVAAGINKVVLLSHLQILENEVRLASRLKNVDIIVAGGSHTLITDSNDRVRTGSVVTNKPSQTIQGEVIPAIQYPVFSTDADGKPIAIVNTEANYREVGRLVIGFDAAGNIIPSTYDIVVSGGFPTDEQGILDVNSTATGGVGAAGNAVADPEIVAITNQMRNVVKAKDGNVFGQTNVFLEGRRSEIRSQETNLGNLTADANLAIARLTDPTVILSLKNGGGVRDQIGEISGGQGGTAVLFSPPPANPTSTPAKPAGGVSQLDIENSLRFNNGLSLVTLTATQLKQIIEHGVGGSPSAFNQGRFPQVSGMSFSFNPAAASGNRVLSLAIKDDQGNTVDTVVSSGALQGDPNRTFRMVTLGFLAGGGDSYPFPSFGAGLNRVDLAPTTGNIFTTPGSEQDALADYLLANFPVGTPYTSATGTNGADVLPAQDTRVQNIASRTDTVIAGATPTAAFKVVGTDNIVGNAGANVLVGYAGDDTIVGAGGADILSGDTGNDAFRYNAPSEGNDTIVDFGIGADFFQISGVGFAIAAINFVNGAPVAAVPTFTYSAGVLSFDADGTGGGGAQVIASLTGSPTLTGAQFALV